jgi:hypothetical protein
VTTHRTGITPSLIYSDQNAPFKDGTDTGDAHDLGPLGRGKVIAATHGFKTAKAKRFFGKKRVRRATNRFF